MRQLQWIQFDDIPMLRMDNEEATILDRPNKYQTQNEKCTISAFNRWLVGLSEVRTCADACCIR